MENPCPRAWYGVDHVRSGSRYTWSFQLSDYGHAIRLVSNLSKFDPNDFTKHIANLELRDKEDQFLKIDYYFEH